MADASSTPAPASSTAPVSEPVTVPVPEFAPLVNTGPVRPLFLLSIIPDYFSSGNRITEIVSDSGRDHGTVRRPLSRAVASKAQIEALCICDRCGQPGHLKIGCRNVVKGQVIVQIQDFEIPEEYEDFS